MKVVIFLFGKLIHNNACLLNDLVQVTSPVSGGMGAYYTLVHATCSQDCGYFSMCKYYGYTRQGPLLYIYTRLLYICIYDISWHKERRKMIFHRKMHSNACKTVFVLPICCYNLIFIQKSPFKNVYIWMWCVFKIAQSKQLLNILVQIIKFSFIHMNEYFWFSIFPSSWGNPGFNVQFPRMHVVCQRRYEFFFRCK